jgi:thiamine-monophosphate kinase
MPFKISDIGEKELIKRLLTMSRRSQFNSYFFDDPSFESLSDDASLIDFGKDYLVATSDMLIKSAHFPEDMNYRQIGKKAVTVNISDLAAMGAKPLGIIVAMGLEKDMLLSLFDEMLIGILEACREYNVMLIGGDTNQSKEFTICGTCLGIVEKQKVMMKCGAQVGDLVAVTGPLGLAAAGFEVLFDDESKFKDLNPNTRNRVLRHALEPEARSKEGLLLAENGSITSATDITDGLVSELGEMVCASHEGIGITIYEDMIPIPPEVSEIADIVGKDPLELALYYGEDFELLLTLKKDDFLKIKDKVPLYQIGYVTPSSRIELETREGRRDVLTPTGYQHFGA